MKNTNKKALHFLTALLDVYRDEDKRELDAVGKLELADDMTDDVVALLLALRVFLQELTGCDGDLIDMTHTLNKLVFQYLIENGAEATE